MVLKQAGETAVSIAAQTGRLDLLTAILAVLALLLAVSSIPVFFFLRKRAEDVAKEAAAEALEGAVERVEKQAILRMELMLPKLVEEYQRLAASAASGDEANRIAATFEEGEK